jgi:isopentenyl diphosphate isomerase/L-lactate dehydrogenase-like FMN-dependent dehydrogenase
LIGRSFAGYLAPRGAAFEHRIGALVCDPAQPDMGAHLPDGLAGKVAVPVVEMQVRFSGARAEFFGARMAAHGLDSIESYLSVLRTFTMLADAAHITCPTLIVECDNDFAGGAGQTLRDAMTVPAEIIHRTADHGADGHCGGPAQEIWAEAVFDWLDRTVGDRRVGTASASAAH